MKIVLEQISKRYHRDWIFRDIFQQFNAGTSYAVTGPNGSGKSTLLQVVAGNILATGGKISYFFQGKKIEPEQVFRHLNIVAPYLELPEEFTMKEFLQFHFKFKKPKSDISLGEMPKLFQLKNAENKYIKNFSTGMKQRLKLGIAFFSDGDLLLLDEPATNLDKLGLQWYREMVIPTLENRIVIIASNRTDEFDFCDQTIDLMDYKKRS